MTAGSLASEDVGSLLRVVHVTSAVNEAAPGIKAAVEGTVESLAGTPGVGISLVGIAPRGQHWSQEAGGRLRRVQVESMPPRAFSYAPGLEATLELLVPDVIHQHGLWQHAAAVVARFCETSSCRCLVSPHGMLSPRARSHHGSRKSIAWLIYQRRALAIADAIQASSTVELAAIRGAGFRQPVAVVPPGVHVPEACPKRSRSGLLTAVCLSRINPLKGILDLVHAWHRVRPNDWRLVIAGPDEEGHSHAVAAAIVGLGVQDTVEVRGPVWGADRDTLYESADLFVLPSHSENFGLVVAEALSQGVPVLATTGAPWQALRDSHSGWWVPTGVEGLAQGLKNACSLDRAVLDAMGRRGWSHVRDTFNWRVSASKLADVYRWLAGRAPRPGCVFTA